MYVPNCIAIHAIFIETFQSRPHILYMNHNEVRASLKSLGYHFVSKSVHLGDVDIFPRISEYVELLMTLKGKVKDHQCLDQIVCQSMQ